VRQVVDAEPVAHPGGAASGQEHCLPECARTIGPAHRGVERRPRRAQSQRGEERAGCSLPVRELVARVPAPCGDHGKDQAPALSHQVFISGGVALAHVFGDMGDVEFGGSAAARSRLPACSRPSASA
jgi:hypothetical protein